MKTIISLQVLPKVDKGNPEEVVDRVIELIAQSGFIYEVSAMETVIEGEFEALMDFLKALHPLTIEAGAQRFHSTIRVDYRPDGIDIAEKLKKYR